MEIPISLCLVIWTPSSTPGMGIGFTKLRPTYQRVRNQSPLEISLYLCPPSLPGLECGNCLLQWIYVAGNNWGKCDDGTERVGCGPQEQFRACADISIGKGAASPPLRPMRPVTKPTKGSYITKVPVTKPDEDDYATEEGVSDTSSRYTGLLIALITLLFVVCCLVALYLYHYHGERIKKLLRWPREKPTSTTNSTTTLHCDSNYSMNLNLSAPVPPPRTKRLSNQLPEISAADANVLSGAEKGQY